MSNRPPRYQQGYQGDRYSQNQGYQGNRPGQSQGYRGSDRPPPQQQQSSRPRGPGVRTEVTVTTNCFPIESLPTAGYIQYDVTFASNPPIPENHSRKRTELMHHLQHTVYAAQFPHKLLYDGGAVAYAHPALNFPVEIEFRLRLRDSAVPPQGAPGVTAVRFKKTNADVITAPEINDVVVYGQDSPKRTSLLNFMQLVVRQSTSNMHVTNGKAYFPKNGAALDNRRVWLESRSGIFHSVRPAIGKLVIVVDSVVAAFYQQGDLASAMLGCLGKSSMDVAQLRRLNNRDFEDVTRWFKGLAIREKKTPNGALGGRRIIKGFHRDGILFTFEDHNGHPVTIKEHYKRTHNTDLRMDGVPGVIVKKNPRLEILPLELCFLEPDQMFKKTLPTHAAQKIIKAATKSPQDKLDTIRRGADNYQNCAVLQAAGMSTGELPLEVPASIIPAPSISFNGGSAVRVDSMKGMWNVMGQRFYEPAGTKHATQSAPASQSPCRWAAVNFTSMKLSDEDVAEHTATLTRCLSNLGVLIEKHVLVTRINGNAPGIGPQQIVAQLDNIFRPRADVVKKDKLFFVLCFLDDEAAIPRKAIKYWGDVHWGVVTQCVRYTKLPKTGPRGNPRSASQYWNNVALKINSRLGGINSRISGSVAYNRLARESVTMIVGADVGHPAPGVRKPSVASVVWSYDQWATKYGCLTQLQDPRTEVIADLEEMMVTAIRAFHSVAGAPCSNMVFYRDGVSEGEFETIKNTEIPSIKRAIKTVWDTTPNIQALRNGPKGIPPMPNLTFLVVGKRHRTLFFTGSVSGRGPSRGIDNCPAGLVVNKEITQPTGMGDYYLLSHGPLLGTSRSSHYTVLCNEVFPDMTSLEDLSFDLCHLYAKATRSVSIPSPVYYADLACARYGFHLPPDDEDNLTISSSEEFNLDEWKKKFSKLHPDMNGRMHFL